VAQRRVPMPAAESKSFACSCGRYGPGNQYGVSTHRSKTKCGGQLIILLDDEEPSAAEAMDGTPPAAAAPDMVVMDGQAASGRLAEPKATGPTTFKQQVETTAELRAYFDYFHVALKYEGDFSRWLEEMARLAVEELFGLELTMRVNLRRRQEQEARSA
jgi:hypothetical protein